MSWGDKEQGKLYNKQYYQQNKGYFKEYNRRYRAEHRGELQAKRKLYNKRYEEKLKAKGEAEERQLSDAEKEQRENMRAVSKEEWLDVIREKVPPKTVDLNVKAFLYGYETELSDRS